MEDKEVVLVIDFGSPYNQLLTRKIRELGVYSELHPHTISLETVEKMQPKAIILSGGPHYVEDEHRYRVDEAIYSLDIPILGICYGLQLLAEQFGGSVRHDAARTYESSVLTANDDERISSNLNREQTGMASMGDVISEVPKQFQVDATFKNGQVAAMSDPDSHLYGVRFYPEGEATEEGVHILKNFLFSISGCSGDWSIERFIEEEIAHIKAEVGDRKVLCALSGGVDSSVVAALIHRAIGDQLTCIFVDHGLLRKNEADEVMTLLADDFHMNIIQIDAEERFLTKLVGVDDPEKKRKIIGNEFIHVFDEEAGKL